MVGVTGFEPATPASRTQYSTRLSYTREADVAARSIAALPASDCRDSLLELAAFAVSRRS